MMKHDAGCVDRAAIGLAELPATEEITRAPGEQVELLHATLDQAGELGTLDARCGPVAQVAIADANPWRRPRAPQQRSQPT